MVKGTKKIFIPIEGQNAFDIITSYFITQGYEKIEEDPPRLVKFRGGLKFWNATEEIEMPRTLKATMTPGPAGGSIIICDYEMSIWAHPGKWDVFFKEAEGLSDFSYKYKNIFQPSMVTVEKEKIIERQTIKVRCHYCGSLNDEGRATCESCGAKL